ncbi:MAG: PaaI family thioesterase [Bacteroidia bacterium]
MEEKAKQVIQTMYNGDLFSKWLGIEILHVEEGSCSVKMKIRKEMLNGFGIAHGGISYSLADSALAFASNSHGRKSVSIETSISHTAQVKENDILTASAEQLSISDKIAVYQVKVTNQDQRTVALFKGTVYRTAKEW